MIINLIRRFVNMLLSSNYILRFSALALWVPASVAGADTAKLAEHPHVHEEVVITGARLLERRLDSLTRVAVIDASELSRYHSVQLDQALNYLPGVDVRDSHGKFGNQVWIQGISSNRIKILLDGEELPASMGSSVDLTQVGTTGIERIEIVKGAASVLYGSDAIGGVINLITEEAQPGLSLKLDNELGSWGKRDIDDTPPAQARAQAQASWQGERAGILTNINYRESNGWATAPQQWDQQGEDGFRLNGQVRIDFQPTTDNLWRLSHEQFRQSLHARITEHRATNQIRDHKEDEVERSRTSLRTDWTANHHGFKLSGYNELFENTSRPNSRLTRESSQKIQHASGQYTFDRSDEKQLVLGADYRFASLTQTKTERGESTADELQGDGIAEAESIELFAQYQFPLGPLQLSPGLRWQHNSDFGDHTAVKLNSRIDLIDSASRRLFIRGSVGTGYRVPNLKERYYLFDHSHLGYQVLGNSALNPETSTSYQFGSVYLHQSLFQLEVNLFRNELKDLIDTRFAYSENSIAIYQYDNLFRALTQGVEAALGLWPTQHLKLNTAWTYLHAVDELTDQRLKDRPHHQVRLTLDYELTNDTQLSLFGRWQSDEWDSERQSRSPDWQQWDLKINHQINPHWRVLTGINNLHNKQKTFDGSYDNRPEQPRYTYLGFSYQY